MIGVFAFLLAVFLQSTILTVPFLIPVSLFYFIYSKRENAFILSFVFGVVLDILLLNPVGLTSIFLCFFLFALSLYSKKFEIDNIFFILIFVLLGSFLYSILFSYPLIFPEVAVIIFSLFVYLFIHIARGRKKPVSTFSPS